MEYKELDLHSHTLKRPDTYVGSVRPCTSCEFLYDGEVIVSRMITYTPAVLRIFVEALSNAVDNVSRSEEFNEPCKMIKVNIDRETGETCVWNDGLAIPVQMKEDSKDNIYIPEMLFGRLLTSSNYNDTEDRYTSGRNGLGISLTNIFSKEFKIRLCDPKAGKLYTQKWKDNMKVRDPPRIKSSKGRGFTQVSWIPDFRYFSLEGYTDDFIQLLSRYVVDAAMTVSPSTSVTLNGRRLGVKSLKDYVNLYTLDKKVILSSETSECVFTSSQGEFDCVSFVNGVYTKDGGTHVDAWVDAFFKVLLKRLNGKFKTLKLTPKDIRKYFNVFVRCRIPNPEFSTQSKTCMVSPKIFVRVEESDIRKVLKWPFVEELNRLVELRSLQTLKKTERKSRRCRIEGFDPANRAGGKDGHKCSLILCEGLSAKTYAVIGIKEGVRFRGVELRGRDWFGIMPLRGKLLNARNASATSIAGNKELVNIIQALGVQYGVDYTVDSNFAKLRYGRILILTDSDVDGLHIQALILNAICYLFPSLTHRPGFISCMQTPVMKITDKHRTLRFYSLREAREHMATLSGRQFSVKYFKGLGTSSDGDVAETFGQRMVMYHMDTEAEKNLCKVFHKDSADARKQWLGAYDTKDLTKELAC
jgi:DNA topoisomerase-2